MAQVNPQLTEIISLLTANATAAHEDAVLAQAALDEHTSLLGQIRLQCELSATYLGDIRNDMIGIHEKLDDVIGLETEQRDLLNVIYLWLQAFGAVQDSNFTFLQNFLDIMNTNAANNALDIIAAVCGDCPPPVDPGEDFACWYYQNTSTGEDGHQGLPFNSGPGYGPFNPGEGFSIHWRGNEYLEDTRIYVWQGVPDEADVLLATLDSVGDFYAGVWNGEAITVSASDWAEFPKNTFSVWICPDGVEPP